MVLITIVDGAYKPTYNWGAPHCIVLHKIYLWVMSTFHPTHLSNQLKRKMGWKPHVQNQELSCVALVASQIKVLTSHFL